MTTFIYEARDQASNKVTKSTVQADSEHSAAKLLIDQGLVPLKIREDTSGTSLFARLSNRITANDKVLFIRQLSTLIGAGLPLAQSLVTVTEQTENKKLQSVVQEVTASVEGGKSLADSFAKHPEVFDTVLIALVSAGESSGTLTESLIRVADQKEKDAEAVRKIRGALTYPGIVLFVIMGVMVFLLIGIMPQVEKLYKDLKKPLPWLSQAVVDAANGITTFWWLAIIAVGALIYFGMQFMKTDAGIVFKDTFKIKVPIFGKMFVKLYMARFTRTGQTLLASGVSMLDMLRLSAKSVNNTLIEGSIIRASDKVKGGKALSFALKAEPYITTLVPQMISIGEQSGQIDKMMEKAAKVYEDELDEEIKSISTAIEPVLMVVLAIAAGGMVAAVLLPIYSLVNIGFSNY